MKVYYKQKSNKNNGKANVLDIEDKNTPSHFLIMFLKSTIYFADFRCVGSLFQTFGPKTVRLFVPKVVVLGYLYAVVGPVVVSLLIQKFLSCNVVHIINCFENFYTK